MNDLHYNKDIVKTFIPVKQKKEKKKKQQTRKKGQTKI